MATQSMTTHSENKMAQWAVEVDGLFCIGSGAVFLLGNEAVSRFMGAQSSGVIAALGLGVLLYGMVLLYDALKGLVTPRILQTLIALDAVWVVVSAVLLVAAPAALNTEGRWLVVLMAAAVAALGMWKYVAIQRFNR